MVITLRGSSVSDSDESGPPSPTSTWATWGEGPTVQRAVETGRALLREEENPPPALDQVEAWLGNVPFEAIFELEMGGAPHQCQDPPNPTRTWFDHPTPGPFATGEEGNHPLLFSSVEVDWETEPPGGTIAYGTPPVMTPHPYPLFRHRS